MRRVLTLALLAAVPVALATAGPASAKPFVMSPGQADQVTAGAATALARQGVLPYAALHIVSPDDGNRTEHNFWASALRESADSQLGKFAHGQAISIRPHPDDWEYGETLVVRPSIPAFRHR